MGVLKVFRRGLKLEKYCKTCKTYIANSEIIKEKGKIWTLMGYNPQLFRIPRLTIKWAAQKIAKLSFCM